MRNFTFTPVAFDQLSEWEEQERKTYRRIVKLIMEAARTPFEGTGKPEPLKGNLAGYAGPPMRSRRITAEHCLVYRTTEEAIIIIACKYHYTDL